jgi:hypothetical protein
MSQPLVADRLIEQAQRATGLTAFDAETFREGLEIFVADVNADPRPEPMMQRTADTVVQALADRLKVTDYLKSRPELLQRPIERPVFVLGAPRTGTTLLSNLLACDPARRSALTWEIDDPVPPPTTAGLKTDPRCLARLEQERAMLAANPDIGKYYRNSAVYPNECIFFMAHDFKTLLQESRGKLPNYRDWVFSVDVASTYAYHKKFLQLLQADAPGTWNLKMPSHALWIPTLLATYPDARLIWTHRDPLTATGSFCSLISLSHMGFRGQVDKEWIAQNMTWQAVEHVDRVMDARERFGRDRIIDSHYADLIRDPIAAMRRLYAKLGDEFTPEAEAGMRSWLDDNPQGKFGKHEYKLAEYGLTPEHLRGRFERYLSEYDVEPEG